MKEKMLPGSVLVASWLVGLLPVALTAAPAPSFTYQGFLGSAGVPAAGPYYFRFGVYAGLAGGSPLASYTPPEPVVVDQGYFTVVIDHAGTPNLFADGQVKYLEIEVKQNQADSYTALVPRQAIHPAPMAQNIPNYPASNNTFTGTNNFNGLATNFARTVNIEGANALLKVASDQTLLGDFNGSSYSGTWLTLRNQHSVLDPAAYEQQWNIIATGAQSAEGPRKLLFRDSTAGAVRMTLDSKGNLGLGIANPQAKLEIAMEAGHSLRLTHDVVPTIESTNSNAAAGLRGYLRIKNVVEIHPRSDGAVAGMLDVRDTGGVPTITLNGGTGAVSARNMPAAGGTQTGGSVRASPAGSLGYHENRNIDVYSLTAPAAGSLLVNASIQARVSSGGAFHFKLMSGPDNAAQELNEVSSSAPGSGRYDAVLPISWLLPVTAGQQVRLFTNAYNQNNADTAFYYGHNLTALFVPNPL